MTSINCNLMPKQCLAIYITATEDPNGAFKKSEPDVLQRMEADRARGLAVESFTCSTYIQIADCVNQAVFGKGFRPLFKLVLRTHGSQNELTLDSKASAGRISPPFYTYTGKFSCLLKIFQNVQSGGMVIFESCEGGKGDRNILTEVGRHCSPDVCLLGNQTDGIGRDDIGSDIVPGLHFRDFRFVNPGDRDVTRICYRDAVEVEYISTLHLDRLYDLFVTQHAVALSRCASSSTAASSSGPTQPIDDRSHEMYELALRLLGNRNHPSSYQQLKAENRDLLMSLFGDIDAVDKHVGFPGSKQKNGGRCEFSSIDRLDASRLQQFMTPCGSINVAEMHRGVVKVGLQDILLADLEELLTFFQVSTSGAASSSSSSAPTHDVELSFGCLYLLSAANTQYLSFLKREIGPQLLRSLRPIDEIKALLQAFNLGKDKISQQWREVIDDLEAHYGQLGGGSGSAMRAIDPGFRSNDLHEDAKGEVQNVPRQDLAYDKAYYFLLGCAHLMRPSRKALFGLLDDGKFAFDNSVVLPIYWGSGILIHPDAVVKLTPKDTLFGEMNVFDLILESHKLAKEQGLLAEWYTNAFKGVCFDQFSSNIIDYHGVLTRTQPSQPSADPSLCQLLAHDSAVKLGLSLEDAGPVTPYNRIGALRRFVFEKLSQINDEADKAHNPADQGCYACSEAIGRLDARRAYDLQMRCTFNWPEFERHAWITLESLPASVRASMYHKMWEKRGSVDTTGDPTWGERTFFWNLHKVIDVFDDEMEQLLNAAGAVVPSP